MAVSDAAVPADCQEVVLTAQEIHVSYRSSDRKATVRALFSGGPRGARRYREVHAVRGVDVSLRSGEALGVIGRNGSGKSTLLRTLAGLIPASKGAVYARSTPVLLGVSAVLQADLSCRRNIVLGATALGLDRRSAAGVVDEVLDFGDLQAYADMPFRTLSSGMRARLQFGVATVVEPDILMIDEMLGVGDAEFRAKSEARFASMLSRSGSVVLVSHSMSFMRANCTRMLWIDRGRLVADGEPEEVVEEYTRAIRSTLDVR